MASADIYVYITTGCLIHLIFDPGDVYIGKKIYWSDKGEEYVYICMEIVPMPGIL